MDAAEDLSIGFHSVADDPAFAMRANWRAVRLRPADFAERRLDLSIGHAQDARERERLGLPGK